MSVSSRDRRGRGGVPAAVPRARVALSTASAYPEGCAAAFSLAGRLGYDGVEVMVWTDPLTREAGALRRLSEHYGVPVLSVHAPTLLVTQRVWGTDPWAKVDRSVRRTACRCPSMHRPTARSLSSPRPRLPCRIPAAGRLTPST